MKRKIIICSAMLLLATTIGRAQSFLHADGQYVKDSNGKVVYLKGVGLGNWMLPEGYMWKFGKNGDRPRRIEKIVSDLIGEQDAADFWKFYRANYITEADIQRIARLGYNSVRPALNSRLFVDWNTGRFKEEGFNLLDNLLKWCKKYHLYVIIDMHAAPGGQTGQNIDDSVNDMPELFANPQNQDLLEKLWVKIAKRYKDEPTVAAYDLLNEPLPERTGAADKYKDQLIPLYKRLIAAIRQFDKSHMFTIEGYDWANNWALFDQPLDSNMMCQFHYYCWDRPDQLKNIDYFLKIRQKLNMPVWVGETGEKDNAIYFATAQYLKKNNIGWSFWPWKKMDTQNTPYSINPPAGWDKITAYSRGGDKPSVDKAKRIFAELRNNIKFENCVYYPDVVNAMMCRVPLKIEAENYGQDGTGNSYFVNDTSFKSKNYRKEEPVPVVVISKEKTSQKSEQAIELGKKEWTAYRMNSSEKTEYNISIKVKAIKRPAKISLLLNGTPLNITIEQTDWNEIKMSPQTLIKGENKLCLKVLDGKVDIDWINIY